MTSESSKMLQLKEDIKQIEMIDNVLDFPLVLRTLKRRHLTSGTRPAQRSRSGPPESIDGIGWHTAAEILDRTSANWSHQIRDLKRFGRIVTVTAAISIDGVTRGGIGTGFAGSETGIGDAEHDALTRAALKFKVVRDYCDANRRVIRSKSTDGDADNEGFPENPVATSLANLVTTNQLAMIKRMALALGINADDECKKYMHSRVNELSRFAASRFIEHLERIECSGKIAVRRAG